MRHMIGEAEANGAATIINAIAGYHGIAYATTLKTKATVELKPNQEKVIGETRGSELDPTLIQKTVEKTLDHYNKNTGAKVTTESNIPVARGLKSSSAASNAAALATIDALGEKRDNQTILEIAIDAAIEAGVTITGAFDDQTASLLGGITFTNNQNNILEKRIEKNQKILVYVPPQKAETRNTHVKRARLLKKQVRDAYKQAKNGEIYKAMTLNGVLYCSTLGYSPKPILDALENGAKAASLSGTGTAYTAMVTKQTKQKVMKQWEKYSGRVIETKINNKGSQIT